MESNQKYGIQGYDFVTGKEGEIGILKTIV
jgi:hypothetical protein